MLNENDVNPLIMETVLDIINTLSPNYIKFIETKYIRENSLVEYVAKEVFFKLNIKAIEVNSNKISKMITNQRLKHIRDMNK